jgi:DNA-binding transcriptional ArsR family regulator
VKIIRTGDDRMTRYLTDEAQIAPYMVFPKFLLDMDLSATAKLLYMLLLDRSRLSMRNDGWQDESGHVFVIYTISSLAEDMHKSEMTVKNGLKALEEADLIKRKHQGQGNPNRIFVKVPVQTDSFLSSWQTEICPPDGKNTVPLADRKLSANKNYVSKTISKKFSGGSAYKGNYRQRSYECKEHESL